MGDRSIDHINSKNPLPSDLIDPIQSSTGAEVEAIDDYPGRLVRNPVQGRSSFDQFNCLPTKMSCD